MDDNVIVVLRSIPPGIEPVPIRVKNAPLLISFLLAALVLICGVFYKIQLRFPKIPLIQEMFVGDIQGYISAVVFGSSCFIVSLILTGTISSISISEKMNACLVTTMRVLTAFIVILLAASICVTVEESREANSIIVLLLSSFISLFFLIMTYATYKGRRIALFVFRLLLTITVLVCIPFSYLKEYSKAKSISQYVFFVSLLMLLASLYKELSDIFVDVVVLDQKCDRSGKEM